MELSGDPATRRWCVLKAANWSPALIIIVAGTLAAALKIYCAATTYVSCDVTIHCRFGQIVDAVSLD